MGKFPAIIITFTIVLVGWAFFRIENSEAALRFISRMFAFDFGELSLYLDAKFWFVLCVAVFFSFVRTFKFGAWLEQTFYATKYKLSGYYAMTLLSIVLLILSMSYIASSGFNPFIYFRF